jgi:hypothetical protein
MKLRISSAKIAYISGVDKTLGVQKSEETRGGQGMARVKMDFTSSRARKVVRMTRSHRVSTWRRDVVAGFGGC